MNAQVYLPPHVHAYRVLFPQSAHEQGAQTPLISQGQEEARRTLQVL